MVVGILGRNEYHSTFMIVACLAIMLQELFLYSQACVNRLMTVLPAFA